MVACNNENDTAEIFQRIPHRPPFLWVDRIISLSPQSIQTEKQISPNLDVFRGHYPDYPLIPGVILCEAIFQSGAILISKIINKNNASGDSNNLNGVPVLTRILNAKFKRQVKPGDTLLMEATIEENIGSAWFLKGKAQVNGKLAVRVEFGCALVDITPK